MILNKQENQNIEFKESWRDEYIKWICDFANAKGGKLYIGVDDSGKIVGIDNSSKLLEDIPNKIKDTSLEFFSRRNWFSKKRR